MQILAEICQNRIAGKDDFFQKSSVAQIKKCEANESWIITQVMFLIFLKHFDVLAERNIFFSGSTEICFRTATSPNHTTSLLEVTLGTKNEIKKIRRGCYRSNNFQDSKKTKETERKQRENKVGCLPQALFSNAFQLGMKNEPSIIIQFEEFDFII